MLKSREFRVFSCVWFLLCAVSFVSCSNYFDDKDDDATKDSKVPNYYRDHIENKELQITNAIQYAGDDFAAFVFFTDAHWGNNQQNSPALINHIIQQTLVRDVLFGGDVITTFFSEPKDAIALGKEFRRAFDSLECNMYYLYGNHDNNSDSNPNLLSQHLSEEEVYDYLQSKMGPCTYGEYYNFYFDREPSKTRFICLDTGRFYYSRFRDKTLDTVSFVIDALKTTPAGWRIVLVSHIWTELKKDEEGIKSAYIPAFHQTFLDLFDAYNNRGSGTYSYKQESIQYDFSEAASKIICCIGGHNHLDALLTSSDGIPIIINTTDSRQTINGESAKKGTIEEQSVSVYVIDYTHLSLNRYRIGRGTDLHLKIEI